MLSKKSGQLRDAAFGGCYGSRQFDVALRRRGRSTGRRVGCLAGTTDNRDSTGSNNRHADWGMHQASAGHAQAWCGMAGGSAFVAAPDPGRPKPASGVTQRAMSWRCVSSRTLWGPAWRGLTAARTRTTPKKTVEGFAAAASRRSRGTAAAKPRHRKKHRDVAHGCADREL